MAGGGGGGTESTRTLQETPTWALATVCFIFIFFGIFIEYLIHLLCHWLKKRRKTALFEAVEKLKSVLMLLGFMSLTLAVTQRPISKICIPNRAANTMLPCRKPVAQTKILIKTPKHLVFLHPHQYHDSSSQDLLSSSPHGRFLATQDSSASSDHCTSRGMTSLISQSGINELNTFIFVLAIMQIVYSVATMALGRLKMRHWKRWEKETQTAEYMAANDPERFRLARQTTFARRHIATTPLLLWIRCFFRQFFRSVAKVDYLTLRHGFIAAHLSTTSSFNFQKYIKRSLEDDFKVVVGISPFMWFVVGIFLLVDVHGWNVYLWISFLPLIIVVVIGSKLEVIVARMALRLQEQNTVIRGTPLVQPNDTLFWFNRPQFILTLLHFTLFMNAFELAFVIWVTLQFGIKSCYHERVEIIVIRVVLAVMVQVLCSYITLPLYALVTQMGSNFKKAVLEEHTAQAIRQWHQEARKKRKKQELINITQSPYYDGDYSSTTVRGGDGSSTTTTTPDGSSHVRTPTLSNFAGNEFEITKEEHPQNTVDSSQPKECIDYKV